MSRGWGSLRLVSWGCDPGVSVGELGLGGLALGVLFRGAGVGQLE